jgi:biopolymer transport protein ExbD
MAGVDTSVGGKHSRARNADLNMIPFIDLLMVTVAFLLITAVWVTNSRLRANALVPGNDRTPDPTKPLDKVLDVSVTSDKFRLAWKSGNDVVSMLDVDRPAVADEPRYRALADRIEAEWKANGSHKDARDAELDQVVLHTDDRTPFKEIAGVMDAIYQTRRDRLDDAGAVASVPAFNVTFAAR